MGLNVDEAIGAPLVPEGMIRLGPRPFADFPFKSAEPEDFDKRCHLLFAAFDKTIRDRPRTEEPDEPQRAAQGEAQG